MKGRGKASDFSAAIANAARNSAIHVVEKIGPRSTKAPPAATKADPVTVLDGPPVRRSKTEERYERLLVAQGFEPKYEALRLRIDLATGRHDYKPDFIVRPAGGAPEAHEVKGGFPRPKDWLRFELAVAQWGWLFTFVWAQWKGGEWRVRRFERPSSSTG